MKGVSGVLFLALWGFTSAQFLNHRPFPTYSLENMPETEFTCRDKILGGYYADVDTQCQMFHICVKVAGVGVQDFRFLCPNGTAFDQDHQICAEWEDVDCDVSTLYYSSDNFDLYRIGSGFESKAVKYGEDEETFALQRAETGDARINKEHQTQRVNQQKEVKRNRPLKQQQQQQNNNEKDIFKGSSSSNFFNNRNGGKETEDDYDDNVNVNQNNDDIQRKKLRQQHRRPIQNENNNEQTRQNDEQQNRRPVQKNQNFNRRPVQNRQQNNEQQENIPRRQQANNDYQRPRPQQRQQNNDYQKSQDEDAEVQTYRPNRPTGFVNNFAGSSYVPTTARPTTTSTFATSKLYNNAENFRQSSNYPVSTPAPFRQTQNENNFKRPTTQAPQKEADNYPTNFPKQNYNKPTENYPTSKVTQNYPSQTSVRNNQYNVQYDVPRIKSTENYPTQAPLRNNQRNNQFQSTENYPTQPPRVTQYNTHYDIPKVKSTKQENYPSSTPTQFHKKPTTPFKQTDNYPTTFAPKFNKAVSNNNENNFNRNNFNNGNRNNGAVSTFTPQANPGYTPVAHQTTQYNSQKNNNNFNQQQSTQRPTPFANNNNNYNQQQRTQRPTPFANNNNNNNNQYSTPKSTPFTQYTPTVPKITSTTPVARSNRYDETQYDDGSYDPKYDRADDEFLKTAHSQNIASSRNEFSKTTRNQPPTTPKPHYESPRPFSVTSNTPKVTDYPKSTPKSVENVSKSNKKVKDVSYDYAYYDTNVGSEPEYELDTTEIKKANVKN